MNGRRHLGEPSERDLAALADGSLSPEERMRVERAVAASPELQSELRLQQRALQAVGVTASERAPASLRAQVARAAEAPPRRSRPFRVLAGTGVAAVAATVALVIVLVGGPAGSPTVADASAFGARTPVSPVSKAADGSPTLGVPRVAGLRFPDWQDHFGWRPVGARKDRLDGRTTATVFYRHGRQLIAYTIVDGRPLGVGSPSSTKLRDGVVLRALGVGPRRVVTWVRSGHTCVLSATTTDTATLLKLASWYHGGAIND
jgi:hypothetical protein